MRASVFICNQNAPAHPRPTPPTGYVVYAVGILTYGSPAALFASIDMGHSWLQLSGGNITAAQALGDSPYVLEASASAPGVVYVGTEGRGSFYRDAGLTLREALLGCERE